MKLAFFLLSVYLALLSSCGFDCDSYLNKDIKPLLIDGIVINKQKSQHGCFGDIVLSSNKIDTLKSLCYCVSNEQELWDYVMEGDSLHKSRKSLTV